MDQSKYSESLEDTLVRFVVPTRDDQGLRIDNLEQNGDVVTRNQGIKWVLGSSHEHK
ncbi:hypothetical protein SPFL3102_00873 [Sporomusaceae bacterium FL31]|nr:hypothetical protein SPFL3101_00715 [Sporomusaceae bacterium FL31]GCE33072.1 hypothetical protein SPFL3102_00873 [Sporomusaceae bacterium]